jgi:hypothetical protein
MDYGKSGNPKLGKHEPINKEGAKAAKPKGSTKVLNKRPSKEELLAQLKAAAEAKKAK